jgi:hypothetical protein
MVIILELINIVQLHGQMGVNERSDTATMVYLMDHILIKHVISRLLSIQDVMVDYVVRMTLGVVAVIYHDEVLSSMVTQ